MKITVKVGQVLPLMSGTSAKGEWVKSAFIGDTLGNYPKTIMFDVFGTEKTQAIMPFVKVGAVLDVSFDLESRYASSSGRWFTSAQCYKVEPHQSQGNAPQPQAAPVQQGYQQQMPQGVPQVPVAPSYQQPQAPQQPVDDPPF